ncbi:MAG: hypothetical protein MI922_22185 [Bacteroidales bacterium]|nr:hypothetical protein [Bacteroidales bacterium]
MSLVSSAIQLGSDRTIMDSYWEYHERRQNWFFSPNPNLDSATTRPGSFDNWGSWDRLSVRQKMTLATLGGFKNDARDVVRKQSHFNKLRAAYMSKWRSDLYSIFWSTTGSGKLWLCNVFVGDAIYMSTGRNFTSGNNHYYDPFQIHRGDSFLQRRQSYKDVMAGDIVIFKSNGTPSHVEIVTEVHRNWICDDGISSIGVGRGNQKLDGKVKHDDAPKRYDVRELENPGNTYFYLV